MFKNSMIGALVAGLAGMMAAPVHRAAERVPVWRNKSRRGRYAGPRGVAGDKLARMAAEGRIGRGHPR